MDVSIKTINKRLDQMEDGRIERMHGRIERMHGWIKYNNQPRLQPLQEQSTLALNHPNRIRNQKPMVLANRQVSNSALNHTFRHLSCQQSQLFHCTPAPHECCSLSCRCSRAQLHRYFSVFSSELIPPSAASISAQLGYSVFR